MRELVVEIIEKLEIVRKQRVEDLGVLTRLMEDDVIVAIEALSKALAENYLQPE